MSNSNNDTNGIDLKLGALVIDWENAKLPGTEILCGNSCRCEPLNRDQHGKQLYESYSVDRENKIWTYLPYGPFDSLQDYLGWMDSACFNGDPYFYAIIDNQSDTALGVASYLNITPVHGSIEVGHINYSPGLQRSIASTETMYLMMKNAFELGYRRYEWKCNSLNEKSRNAALRLGFTHEGIFRQMMVVKGRNRDSAWYSLLDCEWPEIKQAFETWLSLENFDDTGNQIIPLSKLTAPQ